MEVANDLRREQVFLGTPVTASASMGELTVLMASIAGGLGGIAAVIRAVTGRHRHRVVRLTNGEGQSIEVSGLPPEEMDTRLVPFLVAEQKKHEEVRHLYEFPALTEEDEG